MKRVILGFGLAMMLAGPALASGSVVCAGVNNPGGLAHFTKLGWQAFWGVQGRMAEAWLDNHTKVTVHVILTTDSGFVDNTLVSPGSTKTMYFPNDHEVRSIQCSYWSGQQAFVRMAPTGGGGQMGGGQMGDPDDLLSGDPDDLIDPDDLGGVSVDVDPEGKITDLDGLRGKVLKAL